MERKKNNYKSEFTWVGLRVGFIIYIILWALTIVIDIMLGTEGALYLCIALLYTLTLVFNFVISIVHLNKYKEKTLAIVVLIISSIIIIGVLIAL